MRRRPRRSPEYFTCGVGVLRTIHSMPTYGMVADIECVILLPDLMRRPEAMLVFFTLLFCGAMGARPTPDEMDLHVDPVTTNSSIPVGSSSFLDGNTEVSDSAGTFPVLKLIGFLTRELQEQYLPSDPDKFCWMASYGRGVGKVLSHCKGGGRLVAGLCYQGKDIVGTILSCPPEEEQNGAHCATRAAAPATTAWGPCAGRPALRAGCSARWAVQWTRPAASATCGARCRLCHRTLSPPTELLTSLSRSGRPSSRVWARQWPKQWLDWLARRRRTPRRRKPQRWRVICRERS
ncbi:unnamed protein product [Prorocentrum cordatum]|uniref:Uncharacterized protein n=1 Tax=Prorocentrum cordatum TaxID=2364126 RepID=A0ABN9TU83_9DINO|nr:unnamed protein product [Polarella glacialis]